MLLQRGPWLDLSKLLQMIEEDFTALRSKHKWNRAYLYTEERKRIVYLAKLRLAWIQVQAESDPTWFLNTDPRVLVKHIAAQTQTALAPLSLGIEDHEWLELQGDELDQIKEVVQEVRKESVANRSRNIICTARLQRSLPPRGIDQTSTDSYRYTEYFKDRDVSPKVLRSYVKGASGRPARIGVMEMRPLEFAEYEASLRGCEDLARESQ
jgi:hypothetical protein